MGIDRTFLAQHGSHTTEGIGERAITIDVAHESCFALLASPDEPRSPGFIVCHSYGIEFLTYRRTERSVARSLAAMGYPVLAVHCRGYGDSTGSLADATLGTHLEDVRAAMDALSAETGVRVAGLIGAGFGGLVAGLASRTEGIERLLLMNPAVSGAAHFRGMFREMRMVRVTNGDGTGPDPEASIRADGMVDVLGYPVYRGLFDEAMSVDLTSDMGDFRGEALAVHVGKRPSIPRSLQALRARIETGGGSCRIEYVGEPPGATFGGPAFVSGADPTVRIDGQEPIVGRIRELVGEWMA